jgi:hypothetical protein
MRVNREQASVVGGYAAGARKRHCVRLLRRLQTGVTLTRGKLANHPVVLVAADLSRLQTGSQAFERTVVVAHGDDPAVIAERARESLEE